MIDSRTDITAVEERVVAAFMDRLRTAPLPVSPRMPGADVLWLKARLIRQWDAQRKVRRPIELMEPLELAAGVMAAGLLLAWALPSAFEWIPRLIF
jgi:hypothetical protein